MLIVEPSGNCVILNARRILELIYSVSGEYPTYNQSVPPKFVSELQSFKNDLLTSLKQTIPQASDLEEIGLIHKFNRENLISFIGRRGKRGTKLCELRDFFYPTPAGEIDKEVQKLRKEGIIQKNRSGWMSLRKKQ